MGWWTSSTVKVFLPLCSTGFPGTNFDIQPQGSVDSRRSASHPYMSIYSFPMDEPISSHPFHIEDEVDDILFMDETHSHIYNWKGKTDPKLGKAFVFNKT